MSTIAIKHAVRDVLASELDPFPGPLSTLTTPVTIGDTSLEIEPCLDALNRSRIVEGSRLRFLDGQAEMTVTVASVSDGGAHVELETSLQAGGFTGFASEHVAGTTVYSNLLAYGPYDASAMLKLGDPVIFVTTLRKHGAQQETLAGFPVYSVRIQSNRRLTRPDKTIDQESWAEHCENATAADLDAIATVLEQNQQLITDWAPGVAVKLGQYAGSESLFDLQLGPVEVEKGATWHYVGTLDLLVLGHAERMG
jgi:hypothetical protein